MSLLTLNKIQGFNIISLLMYEVLTTFSTTTPPFSTTYRAVEF